MEPSDPTPSSALPTSSPLRHPETPSAAIADPLLLPPPFAAAGLWSIAVESGGGARSLTSISLESAATSSPRDPEPLTIDAAAPPRILLELIAGCLCLGDYSGNHGIIASDSLKFRYLVLSNGELIPLLLQPPPKLFTRRCSRTSRVLNNP
uniref:Uncharacterized protein n=1 Tax=Ananas comosus var. bracteatus TaxID=296719 RepID=A0A6V7P8S6_ANACO|nr:unnamed protein product [Ananas comosus var. bracteatus]